MDEKFVHYTFRIVTRVITHLWKTLFILDGCLVGFKIPSEGVLPFGVIKQERKRNTVLRISSLPQNYWTGVLFATCDDLACMSASDRVVFQNDRSALFVIEKLYDQMRPMQCALWICTVRAAIFNIYRYIRCVKKTNMTALIIHFH